jgi:tRNA(Ile)-lysidine synthase
MVSTPNTLAIRSAVRTSLEIHEAGDCILVAISGGADSLALAHALSVEAPPLAIRVVGVTIDHQLQSASGEQANKVITQLLSMGITENEISKVSVEISQGLEASARKARYEALDKCAEKYGAVAIYLGHTRDDQAESVLLGLGRGSGTRSLSAMAQINGKYIRPLLAITREQTEKACAEMNLIPWNDPHNSDKQFARVRVRNIVLPNLEENIGPGISEALARSAQLLRDDADALDAWTEKEIATMDLADLGCEALVALPKAIRTRILRRAIYDAGAPSGSITAEHVSAVEALVTSWSGQGPAHLPGGVKVSRLSGRLSLLQH